MDHCNRFNNGDNWGDQGRYNARGRIVLDKIILFSKLVTRGVVLLYSILNKQNDQAVGLIKLENS